MKQNTVDLYVTPH